MKTQQSWLFFVLLCITSVFGALWLRSGTDARLFASLDGLATELHNWMADLKEDKPPVTHLPDTLGAPPRPHFTGGAFSPATGDQQMSAMDHTINDRQVCSRPPTKSRSDVHTQLIYKWIDDDGQTHMADRRPEGRIASVVDLGMKKQDFTYEIIPDGVALPINFQGQLTAGSKRMYDSWHFFLGEENLRQSRIQLLLMGDPDRFDAYHTNGSPGSRQVDGFYRMSKNQAVVKYRPARPDRNLAVSFHEISHLITAAHLGPTPPWLTEGLAEYFETMQVQGQSGAIYPDRGHIKLLQTISLPSLREYLSIGRPEWHGEDRNRNYAIAWSIIHFLMEGSPGMYALQETVKQAQENFCKPFSAAVALGKAYPGGLRQLEADWLKWLTSSEFQVQQT